jgi:hypothetical protein
MDDLPEKLKQLGYEKFNYFICRKENSFVSVLIHWNSDYNKRIDQEIQPLIIKEFDVTPNNLYKNFVCLYSPVPHQSCFVNLENQPFRHTFIPELIFLEVQSFIGLDNLPRLTKPILEYHFCFLNNRPTAKRKKLFRFFKIFY